MPASRHQTQVTQENQMHHMPRESSTRAARSSRDVKDAAPRLLRSSLIAALAMSQAAWPLAATAADAQGTGTRPQFQPQRPMALPVGTQRELLVGKGIDRMAIGDEAIAAVTIT